jgi:hypothetical protein
MRITLQPRPPWNLLLAALCVLALDALVFKSGLYQRIASPSSVSGFAESFVRFEIARPKTPGVDDAIVFGASDVTEGVSPVDAEEAFPDTTLRLVVGGVPEATPRSDAYLLHKLDPDRNRYRIIVLPLQCYEACPDVDPTHDVTEADILADTANLEDYVEFSLSVPGVPDRVTTVAQRLLGSVHYARDFRDFLHDPRARLELVHWTNAVGARRAYAYRGHPEDMVGLAFDPSTGDLRWPDRLTAEQRAKYRKYFRRLRRETVERTSQASASYLHQWLGRIVSSYRDKGTLIVFLRMPMGPVRPPIFDPRPGASNVVEEFRDERHVEILDPELFTFLEKPEYFWDISHLNQRGRSLFSRKLLEVLIRLRDTHPVYSGSP